MSDILSELSTLDALQASLQDAGAARLDPVGWHYIEVLSERARAQSSHAQQLLNEKRRKALQQFKLKLETAPSPAHIEPPKPSPSALATLLGEMAQHATTVHMAPPTLANKPTAWRTENPRVQQFKKQLNKISVQMQVKQAIAQAPQNAGPINSHMLVLRSLGLMRDASPDYLNRFITYVDTLLSLEGAGKAATSPKKSASVVKAKK
jgi:Protein of unknown function (DUF2894)